MASSADQPLIIKIPVNNDMVQRAFEMLKSRCVHRNEDQFQISTKIVNHSDIDGHVLWLLDQYKDTDEEFKKYIKRLKFNTEGQQFAKAIVIDTKSRFLVSVIAANRIKTSTIDQHTVLIATFTKIVELSPSLSIRFPSFNPLNLLIGLFFPWIWCIPLFGIVVDNQLADILKKLNNEESKKCLEAMAFYLLGDKIQATLGTRVDVQFIEQ